MLDSSQDLLYIVIAFCVLWFTIFLCWMIYYVAMILKRVYMVMEAFNRTLEAMESFFNKAKEKVSAVGTTLSTLVDLGKRGFEFVQEKRKKTAKKTGKNEV